jgi:hypothetical protein
MDALARNAEPESDSLKLLAQKALQANIAHQHALTEYARKIEVELQELDTLIVSLLVLLYAPFLLLIGICQQQSAAGISDDGDGETELEIQIPGAKKPAGPCPTTEFLDPVRQVSVIYWDLY